MKDEPELNEVELYYWRLFVDIKNGSELVTYTALSMYQAATGLTFTPWESSLFITLDKLKSSMSYAD